MSYTIELSPESQNELKNIFSYIAFQIPELHSLQNATQQIARLEKGIASLSEFPNRYPLYKKEPWYSIGIRIMPIDHYIVFYRVVQDKSTVYIYRILYNRRNIAFSQEDCL